MASSNGMSIHRKNGFVNKARSEDEGLLHLNSLFIKKFSTTLE
jgi:hypothetical protein